MKRLMALLVALILGVGLIGCAATTTEKKSYRSLKCPACGYQFEAPKTHN